MRLALLFHININHLSLSPRERSTYIESDLIEILKAMSFCVNVSICTEDLFILKSWNRDTFDSLVNHDYVKFLLAPHTHILPILFPENYLENVSLGKMLLNRLVNKSKIINVGYPVEVELPESQINDLYGIWKGIVLGETRLKIAGLEQKNYPPVFGVQQNGKIIRCYLSRREFNYRKYLHLYLLDKSTKKEVYEAVKSDFDAYASDLYLLARIDMEVFSFNKTIHGGSIKKMAEKVRILYEYFLRNGVEFIHLDELVPSDKNSQCLSKYQISCNTQEDNKWGSQALQDQVKIRLNTQSVCSTCRYLHLLSLMCSDYYCTESKDIVLTGESLARQKVIIVKDRRYRDPESSVKLQLVGSENSQENNRIIKRIKDSDIKKYFIHYLKAVNEVEKILR